MINKKQIENFLRVNGIEISAPDGEIKSVLLAARWNENDVDTALAILREDPNTKAQHVESLNKLFRSDDKLKPETISSLLGVAMDIVPSEVSGVSKERKATSKDVLLVAIVGILIGVIVLLSIMYGMRVGPFHYTASLL